MFCRLKMNLPCTGQLVVGLLLIVKTGIEYNPKNVPQREYLSKRKIKINGANLEKEEERKKALIIIDHKTASRF